MRLSLTLSGNIDSWLFWLSVSRWHIFKLQLITLRNISLADDSYLTCDPSYLKWRLLGKRLYLTCAPLPLRWWLVTHGQACHTWLATHYVKVMIRDSLLVNKSAKSLTYTLNLIETLKQYINRKSTVRNKTLWSNSGCIWRAQSFCSSFVLSLNSSPVKSFPSLYCSNMDIWNRPRVT